MQCHVPEAVFQAVGYMPPWQQIKTLAAAIEQIAAETSLVELGMITAKASPSIVPARKRKHDPYQPVWDYLATLSEYTTGKALHAELTAKFGSENTPSQSNLYKYLKANGGRR